MRWAFLIAVAAFAQETTIRTRVPLVIAPTTVTDQSGNFVNGLNPDDFLLLENGQPRRFEMDTSDIALTPISMVVVIQENHYAAGALARIRRVGSMIEPLVIGRRGDAAIVAFGDEVRTVQEFTHDSGAIVAAFRGLKAKKTTSAKMIDAVTAGIELLSAKPENRRRILAVISETRDRGSEGKLEDALRLAQKRNVTVYPITFSAQSTTWTAKASDLPLSPMMDILALGREILRAGQTNTADVLAQFTGGRRLNFRTQRMLEAEISRLGEELHSQYLLGFSGSSGNEPEYRKIEVQVKGRRELVIVTRPGYWTAP